jgi:hypothetical protein
MRMSRGLLRS